MMGDAAGKLVIAKQVNKVGGRCCVRTLSAFRLVETSDLLG